MSEKEKIKQYLESQGISKNKFYVTTGLSVGFLDSGNSLGVDKLKIIINSYPDISLRWLVLDEGEMIEKPDIKESSSSSDSFWMKDVIQNQAAAINRMTARIETLEKERGISPARKDAPSAFVPSQIK